MSAPLQLHTGNPGVVQSSIHLDDEAVSGVAYNQGQKLEGSNQNSRLLGVALAHICRKTTPLRKDENGRF
jgi:hypothetical protein